MTRAVGNHHWYLVETPDGRQIVGLDLMESGGPGSGWGYKDMDETMGPYSSRTILLSAPVRLLEM